MWLRPDPSSPMLHPNSPDLVVHRDHESNRTAVTRTDPRILGDPGLRMTLGTFEPTLRIPVWLSNPDRFDSEDEFFLYADDGPWCDATPTREGEYTVTQGGPRRVWDSVERAVDHWQTMGKPGRGRYGVTVTIDGAHRYWVDDPARPLLDEAIGGHRA